MSHLDLFIDLPNAHACLSCVLPDCIYLMHEPELETKQLCPIWVAQNAKQKAALGRKREKRAAMVPQGQAAQ